MRPLDVAPHQQLALGSNQTADMKTTVRPFLLLCMLLSGCTALLPRASSVEVSSFPTFEAARDAFERVLPYRTTLDELKALGFDVNASANVRRIPYPQLVAHLVPNPAFSIEGAEIGIRDCIRAQQACMAYAFRFGIQEHERRGSFLADYLNFRRLTHTRGWRFEGLVLVRDCVVLFSNHGGEPNIDVVEERVNPLGPFQLLGEAAMRSSKR